jgi:hypothetical protein
VNGIKSRVLKLEKKRGKGSVKFCFLALYDGETVPEVNDPCVFTMIMHLGGPGPEEPPG